MPTKRFCSVITSDTVKNLNCIYKGVVIMTDFEILYIVIMIIGLVIEIGHKK